MAILLSLHHLFSMKLPLFQFDYQENHENFVNVFSIELTGFVKNFIASVFQVTEIWQIVSLLRNDRI